MKAHCSLYILVLSAGLTSCQTAHSPSYEDEVICDTVHRYGVSLDLDDWSNRGQNGQIISMRKDGVSVSRSYEGGILHGECAYTYPYREIVEKKENYQQGKLEQELFYYQNGLPSKQISHDASGKQSIITWYESGAPQSNEEVVNGMIVSGEFYNPNQQLESRVDESCGVRTNRDSVGQMQSIDQIQNGQLLYKTEYHPNGTPSTVSSYVNNKVEGKRCTYLPGGEPATVEQWREGVQHGETFTFEFGEKRAVIPYVNGSIHGVEHRYRDGEILTHDIHWVQGQKHGPCYTYLGETTQVDWNYRDRKVPNKATFDMLSNQ